MLVEHKELISRWPGPKAGRCCSSRVWINLGQLPSETNWIQYVRLTEFAKEWVPVCRSRKVGVECCKCEPLISTVLFHLILKCWHFLKSKPKKKNTEKNPHNFVSACIFTRHVTDTRISYILVHRWEIHNSLVWYIDHPPTTGPSLMNGLDIQQYCCQGKYLQATDLYSISNLSEIQAALLRQLL